MAPNSAREPARASNGNGTGANAAPAPASDDVLPIGPPSGLSSIPTQYIQEQSLRQMLKNIGYDEAREDTYRLKGVQLIDTVRQSLQLPVKTFDTAATYYHKFRIRFPSAEYNYEDVALASLFVACKVEDTIKKSKEILCAAHNLANPGDNKTPDDKIFDARSRFTVGLERHILETIGFDFRVQYPQKLLIKMVKRMFPHNNTETDSEGQQFLRVAYDMSIDLYKTFAPIKQPTFTLVTAILELTSLFLKAHKDKIRALKERAWHTETGCVLETMLDLMDLYTQFPKSTKVGPMFEINKLMDVKIDLNKFVSKDRYQRYYGWCDRCAQESPEAHPVTPGSATSPATNNSSSVKRTAKTNEGTLRFVFNAENARQERELVAEYFTDEYEEYEVEVEEPIRESDGRHAGRSGGGHPHRNHGHEHGWSPYPRGRGGHHHDRHRGRKGHGHY
ncbi:hypothetical protein B0H66DRAFT_575482 [Apodospora peruviana]|uniref:RNA polymerase II holoenzyme cyclin-like subunit n=1 Tax=Apodospora peruviana TaxID=516989 RepID=A0AAE0I593_9PEZI|nr:hypothetical protein B0H66DRAFT_575482 [Apodospora peruviana]